MTGVEELLKVDIAKAWGTADFQFLGFLPKGKNEFNPKKEKVFNTTYGCFPLKYNVQAKLIL